MCVITVHNVCVHCVCVTERIMALAEVVVVILSKNGSVYVHFLCREGIEAIVGLCYLCRVYVWVYVDVC